MNQQPVNSSRCDTTAWITLRWIRGSRYNRVHLELDLWDAWLITHVNGRIGTRLGHGPALSRRPPWKRRC